MGIHLAAGAPVTFSSFIFSCLCLVCSHMSLHLVFFSWWLDLFSVSVPCSCVVLSLISYLLDLMFFSGHVLVFFLLILLEVIVSKLAHESRDSAAIEFTPGVEEDMVSIFLYLYRF